MDRQVQLIAWGGAALLHLLLVPLLASALLSEPFERNTIEPIDILLLPPPQTPEPAPEPVRTEPVPPAQTETPMRKRPETAPVTTIVDAPQEDPHLVPAEAMPAPSPGPVNARAPPQASRKGPFRETPPAPMQRALRAFQCARLSPSQRLHCATDEVEDEFIAAMAAEARAAVEQSCTDWHG